jgi:hypothetical protein
MILIKIFASANIADIALAFDVFITNYLEGVMNLSSFFPISPKMPNIVKFFGDIAKKIRPYCFLYIDYFFSGFLTPRHNRDVR